MTKHASTTVERFKKALRKKDPNWPIKESGGDFYSRCPVHGGDDDDSMSFTEGKSGRLLVTCHSQGCTYEEIMRAVGLTASQGFLTGKGTKRSVGKWEKYNRPPVASGCSPTRSPARPNEKKDGLTRGATEHFDYTDPDGKVIGRVCKTPLLDAHGRQAKKEFFQQRQVLDGFAGTLKAGWFERRRGQIYDRVAGPDQPQPSTGAVKIDEPAEFPIYRLPEVLQAIDAGETIFIFEGEKDVDAARGLGLFATTNPGGAGKWRRHHTDALRGTTSVVIVPDNDATGIKHAETVAQSLSDVVDDIRIVHLPGLGEREDFSDWAANGATAGDLRDLVSKTDRWISNEGDQYELLDEDPPAIYHPIAVVGKNGLLVTTAHMRRSNDDPVRSRLVVTDSLKMYCDHTLENSIPLTKLDVHDKVPEDLRTDRTLSQSGVKRLVDGDQPEPVEAFVKIRDALHHFVDLGHYKGDQQVVGEIVTLYVMSTYFIGAFDSVGYLWLYGAIGSGKTKLLNFCVELSMLGELLLGSSSFASIRDIAEAGAAVGFDDFNSLNSRDTDPKLREFILASHRKGASVALKEPGNSRGKWVTRRVRCYGPRMFSATVQPIAALASRCIFITLAASPDPSRTANDPTSEHDWPCDRRGTVDDLWLLGLHNVVTVQRLYRETQSGVLVGRAFEPWRPLLTIARWLEATGRPEVQGLYNRIHTYAVSYQERKRDIERDRDGELLLVATWDVIRKSFADFEGLAELTEDDLSLPCIVSPSLAEEELSSLACREGIHREGEKPFVDVREIGRRYGQLNFEKTKRSKKGARWKISPADVLRQADAVGLELEGDPRRKDNDSTSENSGSHCNWCSECSSESNCGESAVRLSTDSTEMQPPTPGSRTPVERDVEIQAATHNYTNYTNYIDEGAWGAVDVDEHLLTDVLDLPPHVRELLGFQGATDRSRLILEKFTRLNSEEEPE